MYMTIVFISISTVDLTNSSDLFLFFKQKIIYIRTRRYICVCISIRERRFQTIHCILTYIPTNPSSFKVNVGVYTMYKLIISTKI